MTYRSVSDPHNPGYWQILNHKGQVIAIGMSKQDADDFVSRRNKKTS